MGTRRTQGQNPRKVAREKRVGAAALRPWCQRDRSDHRADQLHRLVAPCLVLEQALEFFYLLAYKPARFGWTDTLGFGFGAF